ncbi:MAG: BrnT family toxin [Akkermansiaceae bacterium]|nr:BrnT family toxin [Akkermansiaceae bacterium]
MELDLIDVQFDLRAIKPRELEEALEDPFGVRFLPDADRPDGASRYYALGRTVADRYLFLSFGTDGKVTRVVAAREMTEGEQRFYDRKYAEFR